MAIPTARPTTRLQQLIRELQEARRTGRSDVVASTWDEIKRIDEPLEPSALATIADFAVALGEPSFAYAVLMRALAAAPDNVDYLNRGAAVLIAMGRSAEALELAERAVALKPKSAAALENKAVALLNTDRYREGLELLEQASRAEPNNASVLRKLAQAQNLCGYPERAIENAERAARLEPRNATALATVGQLHAQAGDLKQALAAFERGLRAAPASGICHLGIADITKFGPGEAKLIERMEAQLAHGLDPNDRALIHMALGKAYDDLREYERAFENYRIGNTLRRPHAIADLHDALLALGRACVNMQPPAPAPGGPRPIFIVGMPRSGSTLVEQVLARHPDVATAGELTTLTELVDELLGPVAEKADYRARLTPAALGELRRRYLARLAQGREGVPRVIDKSPGNHVFVGLIRLAFPDATIVHTERHPLDVGLSCYFQNFVTLPWTTDLEWIALRYRRYREFMAFWRKARPDAPVVDVRYEQLVDEPEARARALVERCGLAWDARCLDAAARPRESVRTASFWQVRQPIYKTSVARWTHYAKHLGPLAEGVRAHLTDADLETLHAAGALARGPLAKLRSWLKA